MKVDNKWWLCLVCMCLLCGVANGQGVSQRGEGGVDRLWRAWEARALGSPVGLLSSLPSVSRDFWALEAQDQEAQYLAAIATSDLGRADAELRLLHFVERHPHSSYLPHAYAALGRVYYGRGLYRSAIYWLRRVDTALLTEEMGAGVEFYLAYALLHEGESREALRLLEPLTYYEGWRSDAQFYAGYTQLKEGNLKRGQEYLSQVVDHPTYGAYALAYLAEASLTELRYSASLELAQRGLGRSSLAREVERSLYRSAGLASSQMGDREGAVQFLSQYMQRETNPGRVEQLVLGKELMELGRAAEAEPLLMRVGGSGDDFMAQLALYYAGLAQLSLKQSDRAISSFDRARGITAHAPIAEAATYNAAVASYAQAPGRVGDGSRRMTNFLTAYPTSEYRPLLVAYLSDALYNEPNSAVALAELERITPLPKELQRVRDRVRLKQANRSLVSGDTQLARQQYDELIAKGGDEASVAEAYLWRGEAAYRSQAYEEAIRYTERYLSVRPSDLPLNPNAYYTLGYAYFNRGKYAEAERNFKAYERVISAPTPEQTTAVNNRLGDIAMQRRDYVAALGYYSKAEQAGGKEADHALFNKAMVKGLQRDYRDKATLMGHLPIRYPHSALVDEAIYEQGRALVLAKERKGAEQLFRDFLSKKRHSPFAPKVALQLALSYYAENQLDVAVEAYERVVRHYPNTPEAASALQDLKSISVQLNRVDSYAKLVQEVGATGTISAVEMDSLAYIAAEGVVANGNQAEAMRAFDQYLARYPHGAFVNNAHYGKALIKYEAKDYRGVVADLAPLAPQTRGQLAHDTYRLLASSYERLQEPGRAAEAYYALALMSPTLKERSQWVISSVAAAERSASRDFVQSMVKQLERGELSVGEEAKAAIYLAHAKSEARHNNKSVALASAKKVRQLRDYGGYVIADIIIALDLQDRGEYKQVQQMMQRVTDRGTTDAYWLARAFILLSDSYAAMGDKETARIYLESVKSSYTTQGDGILRMIDERLGKL